jgi:hypothetical protein
MTQVPGLEVCVGLRCLEVAVVFDTCDGVTERRRSLDEEQDVSWSKIADSRLLGQGDANPSIFLKVYGVRKRDNATIRADSRSSSTFDRERKAADRAAALRAISRMLSGLCDVCEWGLAMLLKVCRMRI